MSSLSNCPFDPSLLDGSMLQKVINDKFVDPVSFISPSAIYKYDDDDDDKEDNNDDDGDDETSNCNWMNDNQR